MQLLLMRIRNHVQFRRSNAVRVRPPVAVIRSAPPPGPGSLKEALCAVQTDTNQSEVTIIFIFSSFVIAGSGDMDGLPKVRMRDHLPVPPFLRSVSSLYVCVVELS